jgi:hypothetical protein
MAIYPIIPGQKVSNRNSIPPRAASHASKPASQPAPEKEASADLIDFGDSEIPAAPVPAENPAAAAVARDRTSKDSMEIRQMLNATGHKAPDGPLIDFTGDMKHDLPKTQPPELKRNATSESNDVFFDVES